MACFRPPLDNAFFSTNTIISSYCSAQAALAIIKEELESEKIRVKIDDRDYMRNGAKYFEWEVS